MINWEVDVQDVYQSRMQLLPGAGERPQDAALFNVRTSILHALWRMDSSF